jgi:hypothetical protein
MRVLRQMDLTGFKARALRFHPHKLVALRLDANWQGDAGDRIRPKFLDEMQARTGLLDQDGIGLVFVGQGNQLSLELRKLEPTAPDVEEV